MSEQEQIVTILYTNYRGETGLRKILPRRIWFGATEYHSEPQWLLDGADTERNVERTFAMKDVRAWFVS